MPASAPPSIGCPSGSLGMDQAVDPFQVRLGRGLPVLDQCERICIHPLARSAERVFDRVQSVFQGRPPAFEQADARLRRQIPEEGEANAKARVLGGVAVWGLMQELEEESFPRMRDVV